MRTASRLLVASIASLSFSGLALAQDAPAGDAPADGTAPAGDPAAAPAPTPAPDAGGAVASAWPRAIIDRPLTLPKGLLQIAGDLSTNTSNFFDPANIRIGVGYGITDDFEVNLVGYAFDTSDKNGGGPDKGDLALNAGYKLVRGAAGGKLEIDARAQLGYNLAAKGGDGGLDPIGLGVHVQYNVTPKIALITGAPGQGGGSPLGPASPQLEIGVTDPKFTTFNLPVGVGFQATPELFLEADTVLATFTISHPDGIDPGNLFIFDKRTPLSITASYNAMPALDLYANLTFANLTPQDGEPGVGDQTFVGIGARYYIGPAVKGAAAAPAAM